MSDPGGVRLPLEGIRVLELGYGIAAPVAARNLAQFGADVIRVESARRPDSLRLGGAGWLPPRFDHSVRRDTMPSLNFSSSDKRSIGLEIDHAEGRAVFEQLVAASDVVVTNISEDALAELGIAYEDIRALKPDIIYVTLPAFGSDGPYRSYRTWGHNLSAAAGVDHLIGWPDREPVQIGFAYPDYVSAQAAVVAVLGALDAPRRDRRRRAHRGVAVRDDGRVPRPHRGRCPTLRRRARGTGQPGRKGARPHGLYPARGDDRWVAVTVQSQAMWERLCRVPGLEALGDRRAVRKRSRSRLEHHDVLDDVLAAWTAERTDWEAATELQAAGVAASPVLDAWDVIVDPQLAARDFFHALPHARLRARPRVRTSGSALGNAAAVSTRAAPAFGEHSRDILHELDGLRRRGDRPVDRRGNRGGDGARRRRCSSARTCTGSPRCSVSSRGARRRSTPPPR